ncbi:MAG: MoaD/ThiS family protein [Gemmatimonadetes bacterium]|nr:MoaD/ThiS family protein [Gemmatimonadota bacterium]
MNPDAGPAIARDPPAQTGRSGDPVSKREDSVQFRVTLHARAADVAEAREVRLDVPDPATGADLKRALAAACPPLAGLLASSALANDREYLSDRAVLEQRDVHVIPPVSGG